MAIKFARKRPLQSPQPLESFATEYRRKIRGLGYCTIVTIPAAIVQRLDLKQGDVVSMAVDEDDQIVVRKQ